jgi:FixJ family two-component response regulator
MMTSKNTTTTRDDATVLLLDGEPEQSHAVRLLLEKAGFSTLEFDSWNELRTHWDWSRPSCLVTDLRKFGTNGQLRKELAKEKGPFPLIVLSGHHVTAATAAVQNSSFRWLPRPPQPRDMTEAVQKALDQDREHFQGLARAHAVIHRLKTLTPKERQVLDLLMAGKSNKSIANTLDIGVRTVELRRHCLFQKLKANSLAELVLMVVEAKSLDRIESP